MERRDKSENASRIDKFLLSFPWVELFTQIRLSALPNLGFDYNPIVLTCGDDAFNKSYFKFESWWLNVEGLETKLRSGGVPLMWQAILTNTSLKIAPLKKKLKEWSKENRGNWLVRKEQIGRFEDIQVHRALIDDE